MSRCRKSARESGALLEGLIRATLVSYKETPSLLPDLESYFRSKQLKLRVRKEAWELRGSGVLLRGAGAAPQSQLTSDEMELHRNFEQAVRAREGLEVPEEPKADMDTIVSDVTLVSNFDVVLTPEKSAYRALFQVKSVDLELSVGDIFVEKELGQLLNPERVGYSPYVAGLDYALQLKITSYLEHFLLSKHFLWNLQLLVYQVALENKLQVLDRLQRVLEGAGLSAHPLRVE